MSLLKDWKDYYKLSPRDLSMDSIKTLRWASAVGLFGTVLALLTIWNIVPFNSYSGLTILICFTLGAPSLFHRLPNLLALPDKHLDEWSRKTKKDAESFAYRVLLYAFYFLMLLGLLFIGGNTSGLTLVLSPSLEQILFSLFLFPLALQLITSCHMAWSVDPFTAADVKEMYEIEKPRKRTKPMAYLIFAGFFIGAFGRGPMNHFFGDKLNNMAETCVITMETEVSLVQLKNLKDCKSLAEVKK